MTAKRPNSKRNLDLAIERILGNTVNPFQIRVLMANTIVGQLLPSGVVKGGSALKLRYGNFATRFTTDLDTARRNNLNQFTEELEIALKTGWNGFTGRLITKKSANPKSVPAAYVMRPYEIKLEYNGKSWITVPLEIGHDEIGDTDQPDYIISKDVVNIFLQLNFPEPAPIPLLSIHHQVAQKLHALSTENSERAHDLIDLQLIVIYEPIDFSRVNRTCQRLFKSRRQQGWPPIIAKGINWESLYAAQSKNLPVALSVDEAVEWVNKLISDISKSEE